MNEFSSDIYRQIVQIFPTLEDLNQKDTPLLEFFFENEHNAPIGGLYIQTSEEDEIWIKAEHPYTSYRIDEIEELFYILGGLVSNELYWVISYEEGDWDDTFFVTKDQDIDKEEGYTYKIMSWNGEKDQLLSAE